MRKTKDPFELVIHIDELGTRATASYRIRIYDDDDVIIDGTTTIEGVTLDELGAAFPWGEFIDSATKGTLVAVEEAKAKLAEAEAKLAEIKKPVETVEGMPIEAGQLGALTT